MRTRYALLGLILWLSGTAASNLATFDGVRTERIELRLTDGTPIGGTLYCSEAAEGGKPGVVVLHGAAVSHRCCAPGLSTPLARKGYIVLAIDLIGHGDSGGSRPRSEFGALADILVTPADHPEVEAAIGYLQKHPLVDRGRLALIGHSRGGWAAANVAKQRDDIHSVVTIGLAPSGCDQARPRNLFMLTGDHDPFASESLAGRAIADATGGRLHASHTACGDFRAGTARRWVMLPGAFHISALADPAVSRYATSWLGFSFQQRTGKLSGNRLLVTIFGALAATLGGVAACGWVLNLVLTRWDGLSVIGGPCSPYYARSVRREGGRRFVGSTMLGPCMVFGSLVLAAPLAAWLSDGAELGPLQFAVPTLVLATIAGVLCFGLALCMGPWLCRRTEMSETLPALGAWAMVRKGTGLAVLGLGLSITALTLTWGFAWVDLVPTAARLAAGLCLFPLLFPAAWLLAKGLERLTAESVTRWTVATRGVCWLLAGVAVWLGFAWLVIDDWPLFGIPVWLLGMSQLVPLPLWLLPHRPGMTLARSLCHAAGAAWLLACHLPMVHAG